MTRPAKAKPSDARQLWHLLHGRGFVKAKNLAPMNARKVRAVCAEFPEHFLSTQRGYKVVRECTDTEIEAAVADLRSRVDKIGQRAAALDGVLYSRKQRGLEL